MREYETIFVLRPEILDEDRSKVLGRVDSIIEKLEGQTLKIEEWGKRRLAYRIKKNSHGIYYYYQYLGFNDLVEELERNLRILEPVLKYLTVKLDDDVDTTARLADDKGEEEEGADEAEAEAEEATPAADEKAASAESTPEPASPSDKGELS